MYYLLNNICTDISRVIANKSNYYHIFKLISNQWLFGCATVSSHNLILTRLIKGEKLPPLQKSRIIKEYMLILTYGNIDITWRLSKLLNSENMECRFAYIIYPSRIAPSRKASNVFFINIKESTHWIFFNFIYVWGQF